MKIVGFLLAAVCAVLFFAPNAAEAQATRTWVSGVGDDANPCSRTAPCKTFAGSISKTAPFGEINCLDPGGFGAVTITKSITIRCVGVQAGVLVSGTNGIVVSVASTDRVVLDGLDIDGITTGLSGVAFVGQGHLLIRNCLIHNFNSSSAGFGVNVTPSSNSPVPSVVIQDSTIAFNGFGTNGGGGINATGGNIDITNTLVHSNVGFNLGVGTGATAVLSGNTFIGTNPTDISITGTGSVISYGNNVLRNGGSPTSTVPLQ